MGVCTSANLNPEDVESMLYNANKAVQILTENFHYHIDGVTVPDSMRKKEWHTFHKKLVRIWKSMSNSYDELPFEEKFALVNFGACEASVGLSVRKIFKIKRS